MTRARADTQSCSAAMAGLLVVLPHFGLPVWGAYKLPPASLYLVAWVALTCLLRFSSIRMRIEKGESLRPTLVAFFVYCAFSAVYGYCLLSSANRTSLHLVVGDVSYLSVAGQRLLQLILAVLAFEVVRQGDCSPTQLLRWWLIGTSIAVALHVVVHVASPDDLTQRAGIFTEGNQGGLYYLLSVFIAFEYRRRERSTQAIAFVYVALVGVFLTRSSAAFLVLALALSAKHILSADSVTRGAVRGLVALGVVAAVASLMLSTGVDFGLIEKLFEEDVTSTTFSRIDRLASIDTAFSLFLESPWIGHGLQTYGFLANNYLDGPLLAVYDESFRRIPNNIYAELAAELGLVGLILFGAFAISLLRRIGESRSDRARNLLAGTLGVLLYWLAFPTYSVLFVWVFFAIACAASRMKYVPALAQIGRSKRTSNGVHRKAPRTLGLP